MPPSGLSTRATRSANQSARTRPCWCRSVKISVSRRACSLCEMPRKSGIRQISHSSRTDCGSLARAATSASWDRALSASRSSLSRTRVSQGSSVGRSRLSISAARLENSRSGLRHSSFFTGAKRWSQIASASSGSSGPASPVTPKLPSERNRPARPAIWAISCGKSRRIRRPSNLERAENATWSISRFSPMPMASVATR